MNNIKLRTRLWEIEHQELITRLYYFNTSTLSIPDYKLLIPVRKNYFIKNGILAMFFSAIPVPRTTARSGSSAT